MIMESPMYGCLLPHVPTQRKMNKEEPSQATVYTSFPPLPRWAKTKQEQATKYLDCKLRKDVKDKVCPFAKKKSFKQLNIYIKF
jgi:hypothetical protein